MTTDQIRKAAILVAALEPADADAVLERLTPAQSGLIRRTIIELPVAQAVEEEAIIQEFIGVDGPIGLTIDDVEYIPSANGVVVPDAAPPFEFLYAAAVEDLGELLADERPQVVAVVVSHLPAEQAAQVVASLPGDLQTDVVRRLARLDETDPTVLHELEAGLERRFRHRFPLSGRRTAGVGAVKRIFAEAGPEMRRQWLSSLSQQDPRLAANLTQPTFTFVDLTQLTDDSWQLLLEVVDEPTAAAALAGAEPEFAVDVVARLPRAEARRLQRAIDTLGPTRISDLDAAQDDLLAAARNLEMQGRLEWRDAATPTHLPAAA